MKHPSITRHQQRLDTVISRTKQISRDDQELLSHWAKYVCILAAGFIEKALLEVMSDFCQRTASPHVAKFSRKALSRYKNPKSNTFIEVVRAFDESRAKVLEAYLELDGRKDAIDSIMANRHLIAHGRDSGITMVRVTEFYQKSVKVVEFLESQL